MLEIKGREIKEVYAYIRVSTETQAEKGYGLDYQKEAIEKFCKQHKIKILEMFKDEGISGRVFKERHDLREMIDTLRKDTVVIVLNTSRLWRDDETKVQVVGNFKVSKAHIYSIEQPQYDLYTKEPNEKFFNTIMEALDELERSLIARKLSNGRKQKAKQGVKGCGNTPLGYKWSRNSEKKPEVIIDNDEKFIVKLIFSKYLDLKSIGKVKRFLKDNGFKTRKGNDFEDKSLRQILTNEFYIGIINWGLKEEKGIVKEVKYDGKHKPIINKIIFGKVQAELARKKRGGRPKKPLEIVTPEDKKLRQEVKKFREEKMEEFTAEIEKQRSLLISLEIEGDKMETLLEVRTKELQEKMEKEFKERFGKIS